MKTIYTTYVVMHSQEQLDRMKQLCINNDLKVWDRMKFDLIGDYFSFFERSFGVFYKGTEDENQTEVTEQEFIELIKTTKLQQE